MKKLFIILLFPLFTHAQIGVPPGVIYNGQSTPFKPTDVTSATIKFWVSADSLTGLSDGDPVSTWVDKSGNGFNATQTGSNRPVYKTGILNSKPVVRFDRSSTQYMTASIGSVSQPYTFFIVVKFSSLGATNMYALDGGALNSGILGNNSGTTSYQTYAGGGSVTISATNTNWNIIGMVYNGGSTVFSLNGMESSPGNPGGNSITNISIGSGGSAVVPMSGDIAEIIYYSGTVSGGDRTLIYNYLAAKYGL